jgi:hypothetical protein
LPCPEHNCTLCRPKKVEVEETGGIFTIVRLADTGTLDRACELAGINPSEVSLTQKAGEQATRTLTGDFRIISFDGRQITISESVKGERSTRGFAVE